MRAEIKEALGELLLSLGDDDLILGQRDSEWCGHAPILEEDIAFANISLDELGHASLYYSLLAELIGEEPQTYPDHLVYWRRAEAYRNIQMVELPRGDWAFSILRQFLFDSAELVRLEGLVHSSYRPLAEAAAKMRIEELYHDRHTRAWVRRLGMGTEESAARLQKALKDLWPYTAQLFHPIAGAEVLVSEGILPSFETLASNWEERVLPLLKESGLEIPTDLRPALQRTEHTPHLAVLLEEMQSTARLEPGAVW